MDKSKFLERPGDSEGFTHEQAFAEQGIRFADEPGWNGNPVGWQEVDGVKLPSVEAWAEHLCVCATSPCTCKAMERADRRARPGRRHDEQSPAMAAFAERVAQGSLDTAVRLLSDSALEECFQAWLDAATLKHNMPSYKDNLRRRIAAMVARNMGELDVVAVDLRRLS